MSENTGPKTNQDTKSSFTQEAKSRVDRFKKIAKSGRKREKGPNKADNVLLPSKHAPYFLKPDNNETEGTYRGAFLDFGSIYSNPRLKKELCIEISAPKSGNYEGEIVILDGEAAPRSVKKPRSSSSNFVK